MVCTTNADGVAVLVVGLQKTTIRAPFLWLQEALFGTSPLCLTAVIIVSIRPHHETEGTERIALVIIAPAQLDGWVFVPGAGNGVNQPKRPSFPDQVQAVLVAGTSVSQHSVEL